MRKHKLNILWLSVAPHIRSGYGQVTKNICFRLSRLGWPIVIIAYYGLHEGGMIKMGGVPVLPIYNYEKDYGRKSVPYYCEQFKIDIPILFSDFWRFDWFPSLENSTFYGPIDHSSYGLQHIKTLKRYSDFITITEWARKEAKKYGRDCKVFPHGVDTKVFHPMDKSVCREYFGFREDKFIIGIVAANNDPEPRKGWDDLLISLSEFLKRNPGEKKKIFVFAFTNPRTDSGYDLPKLVKKLGLKDIVRFPELLPQIVGLPDQEMAMLYSTFDLFLSASRREGFNIPLLEAQACGVPVVASNTSAHTELVKGHGWLVKMGETVFAPRGWKCQKVDREDLVKKIEDAYFSERKRKIFREKSLKFARQFDWEKLFREKWIPLLESLSSQSLNIISSS